MELPNGQTLLIDAGEKEYGEAVTSYIKSLGYESIDYVIPTHPHSDHIGGMAQVLNAFSIGKVYMPRKEHTTAAFTRMLDVIETKEIPLYTAKAGVTILEDGALRIEVLSPVSQTYEDMNNYSAVVKVTYGESEILFTGDAEKTVEQQLLSKDLESEILKVGHHGSSTSSSKTFLQRVKPRYAVISCAKHNDYGHPHRETMTALGQLGCTVLRTDEMGTIVLDADAMGNVERVGETQ